MDKKTGMIILLICIVIIGIGIFEYGNEFTNKYVQVGSTSFKLPNGYYEGIPNEFGSVNITDGEHSIFLMEYNDSDVMKHIYEYQQLIKNQNQSMKILNYTIENISMYKSDNINNPYNVHYWVVKNNKTYNIYKWDENPKMEYIVFDLINS